MNKSSPRLAILRAQLAAKAEAEQLQRDTMRLMALAPIRCKAPAPDADSLPMPPSYWDDLEHWLKTLAPAKPATPFGTIPAAEPMPGSTADVWHSEAPSAAGVYIASAFRDGNRLRWFDGQKWHQDVSWNATAAEARCSVVEATSYQSRVQWLRLIEADAPAARLASTSSADGAALTHSVCIKSYGEWNVGEVVNNAPSSFEFPHHWLTCDKYGWIPHTPTADSTCPVPDGVNYEARLANGDIGQYAGWKDWPPERLRIVSWRPIADGSK